MSGLRLRYQTIEFPAFDIHLRTLRDRLQFEDAEGVALALGISSATWPLFGVLWSSGRVLARLMAEREIAGLRILEIGCGIGLASLVLKRRAADITATDLHPEAAAFLTQNTVLNEDAAIPFVRAGWADPDCGLGRFDLIIGSDLLYEATQADELAAFVDRHASPVCEVVLIDPGRGLHGRFARKMIGQGFLHSEAEAAGEAVGETMRVRTWRRAALSP